MNNPKLPAPAMQEAAKANPLSDEYVNAVIQRYGYQSPETVIARLNQWIGLHGGEDSVTLLMYEAHKALSKLRADGVPSAQPAFWIDLEPISGSQNLLIRQWQNLGALGPGKHTLFLSPAGLQASAPVADEPAAGQDRLLRAAATREAKDGIVGQLADLAARLAAQLRECTDTLGAAQIDEHRAMRAYADSSVLLAEVDNRLPA